MKRYALILPALLISTAALAEQYTDNRVFTLKSDHFATEAEAFDAGINLINREYAKTPKELSQTRQIFGIEDGAERNTFQVNDANITVVTIVKAQGAIAYQAKVDVNYQYDYIDNSAYD